MSRDQFAHLRAGLAAHRALTEVVPDVPWCGRCEVHLADASGLCPVCAPDERAA